MNLLHPKHYIQAGKQLYQFVIHPNSQSNTRLTVAEKIKGTWTMFIVKLFLVILIRIVVGIFYNPVNQTTARHSEEFSPLQLLFIGVLMLPILEEIAFRLSLKFKPIYLALSTGVFSYYWVTKIVFSTRLSNTTEFFKERVIAGIFVIIVSYSVYQLPQIKKLIEHFWEKNFKWILYFFCTYFAFMHIFNYKLSPLTLLWMPLIILPKFISALCYGYIRINYGFVYSIALHLSWNAIGVIMRLMPGED